MLDQWPTCFESLGDNCEWGFVQRHYGVDEGSLLKWCRIKNINDIIAFLESDFTSFYQFENLIPISEDMVIDTSCGIEYHSEMYSEKHEDGWRYKGPVEELIPRYAKEYEKRIYLLDKFKGDLKSGKKIWIYKENKPVALEAINRLARALQRFNPANKLLHLELEPRSDEVPDLLPGVFVRPIKSLAPYWAVNDAIPQHWYEVCVKFLLEREAASTALAKPEGATPLPVAKKRHLRPTSLTLNRSDDIDERVRENIARRSERFPEAWEGQNSWVSRFEIGAYYVAPLFAQLTAKPDSRVLEVGCGQGQKALSYLPFVGSVLGIDIDADHVDYANRAAEAMGAPNAEFRHVKADDVATILQSDQFDVVVLYAVLEHLTPAERLNLLGTIWSHLRDDGLILIGETPNRIASFDAHTTNLQFVDTLTNELYFEYTDNFTSRTDYREFMSRFNDKCIGSYRAGRGVSFHEFDLMFGRQGGISEYIICDSYNALLRNAYPLSRSENSFLDMFRWHRYPIHQCFSRYWIELFLRKTPGSANRHFYIQDPIPSNNTLSGCDAYGLNAYGVGHEHAPLTFNVPKGTTEFQLMFDVAESVGAVELLDQSDKVVEILDFEDLKSRVPEFQRYVVLDRPRASDCDQLTLRPLGAKSRFISGGLGLFGAEPTDPRDPRNPKILSRDSF